MKFVPGWGCSLISGTDVFVHTSALWYVIWIYSATSGYISLSHVLWWPTLVKLWCAMNCFVCTFVFVSFSGLETLNWSEQTAITRCALRGYVQKVQDDSTIHQAGCLCFCAGLQYFYLLLNGYFFTAIIGPVMYNLWIWRVCNRSFAVSISAIFKHASAIIHLLA